MHRSALHSHVTHPKRASAPHRRPAPVQRNLRRRHVTIANPSSSHDSPSVLATNSTESTSPQHHLTKGKKNPPSVVPILTKLLADPSISPDDRSQLETTLLTTPTVKIASNPDKYISPQSYDFNPDSVPRRLMRPFISLGFSLNQFGQTPIHQYAMEKNSEELRKVLITDIHAHCNTIARKIQSDPRVVHPQKDILYNAESTPENPSFAVRYLLSLRDNDGICALFYSLSSGDLMIPRILMAHGAYLHYEYLLPSPEIDETQSSVFDANSGLKPHENTLTAANSGNTTHKPSPTSQVIAHSLLTAATSMGNPDLVWLLLAGGCNPDQILSTYDIDAYRTEMAYQYQKRSFRGRYFIQLMSQALKHNSLATPDIDVDDLNAPLAHSQTAHAQQQALIQQQWDAVISADQYERGLHYFFQQCEQSNDYMYEKIQLYNKPIEANNAAPFHNAIRKELGGNVLKIADTMKSIFDSSQLIPDVKSMPLPSIDIELVQKHPELRRPKMHQQTPLVNAILSGDTDSVQLLLDYGANPELASFLYGQPILNLPIYLGDIPTTRAILHHYCTIHDPYYKDYLIRQQTANLQSMTNLVDNSDQWNGAEDIPIDELEQATDQTRLKHLLDRYNVIGKSIPRDDELLSLPIVKCQTGWVDAAFNNALRRHFPSTNESSSQRNTVRGKKSSGHRIRFTSTFYPNDVGTFADEYTTLLPLDVVDKKNKVIYLDPWKECTSKFNNVLRLEPHQWASILEGAQLESDQRAMDRNKVDQLRAQGMAVPFALESRAEHNTLLGIEPLVTVANRYAEKRFHQEHLKPLLQGKPRYNDDMVVYRNEIYNVVAGYPPGWQKKILHLVQGGDTQQPNDSTTSTTSSSTTTTTNTVPHQDNLSTSLRKNPWEDIHLEKCDMFVYILNKRRHIPDLRCYLDLKRAQYIASEINNPEMATLLSNYGPHSVVGNVTSNPDISNHLIDSSHSARVYQHDSDEESITEGNIVDVSPHQISPEELSSIVSQELNKYSDEHNALVKLMQESLHNMQKGTTPEAIAQGRDTFFQMMPVDPEQTLQDYLYKHPDAFKMDSTQEDYQPTKNRAIRNVQMSLLIKMARSWCEKNNVPLERFQRQLQEQYPDIQLNDVKSVMEQLRQESGPLQPNRIVPVGDPLDTPEARQRRKGPYLPTQGNNPDAWF